MGEIWKDIPGYEGLYQASSRGNIKSLDRFVVKKNRWGTTTKELRKGRILAHIKTNGGYWRVTLAVGEDRSLSRIHSLVLLTFVGVRPEGELARHLDGNPANNTLSNLAYGTPRDNVIDIYRYGKVNGVLTIKQVIEIREFLRSGSSNIDLAEKYSIGKGSIRDIKIRKTFNWLGDDGAICKS
jgi:hypothetical protein